MKGHDMTLANENETTDTKRDSLQVTYPEESRSRSLSGKAGKSPKKSIVTRTRSDTNYRRTRTRSETITSINKEKQSKIKSNNGSPLIPPTHVKPRSRSLSRSFSHSFSPKRQKPIKILKTSSPGSKYKRTQNRTRSPTTGQ